MKMHVGFEGGKELYAALQELSPNKQRKDSIDALRGSAVPIMRIARGYVAREPGPGPHLQDNIGTQALPRPDLAVAVGPEKRPDYVFWGGFLEFGTRKMAARPWLRPAFQQGVWDSLSILRTLLWANIKKRKPKTQGT